MRGPGGDAHHGAAGAAGEETWLVPEHGIGLGDRQGEREREREREKYEVEGGRVDGLFR